MVWQGVLLAAQPMMRPLQGVREPTALTQSHPRRHGTQTQRHSHTGLAGCEALNVLFSRADVLVLMCMPLFFGVRQVSECCRMSCERGVGHGVGERGERVKVRGDGRCGAEHQSRLIVSERR
jgi:hypothetical protein